MVVAVAVGVRVFVCGKRLCVCVAKSSDVCVWQIHQMCVFVCGDVANGYCTPAFVYYTKIIECVCGINSSDVCVCVWQTHQALMLCGKRLLHSCIVTAAGTHLNNKVQTCKQQTNKPLPTPTTCSLGKAGKPGWLGAHPGRSMQRLVVCVFWLTESLEWLTTDVRQSNYESKSLLNAIQSAI